MNKFIRAAILAFALIAGFSPAFAQAPPPVPALPDAERRTSYVIAATTCICNVNFALYGDSTDYAAWVEVYLNGVRVNFNDATFGWTITSPTGALGSIPRPVTDAVLTFNGAQTGTVQIVGARRPRRTSTFAENRGVAARDLNQILNDMIAQNRETWDKTNDVTGRALISQPGNTIGLLPLPSACQNKFLGFDATGLIPQCNAGGAGSGNVVGPLTSIIGDVALFANTTGTLLTGSAGSVDTNALNLQVSNYSAASTDCGKTIVLNGAAFYALTVGAATGFSAKCSIVVANIDTGRGKKMAINGVTFPNNSILWPGQSFTLKNEANLWTVINPPDRWKLAGSVQFEVNSAGSDLNDGLATGAANAFQTINGASAVIGNSVDAAGQFVKLHTNCSGVVTYTGSISFVPIVGQPTGFDPASQRTPILSGDTSTPTNCILTSASGATVQAIGAAQWNIEGFQVKNTDGSSPCILVDQQSFVRAGVMDYNSCNGAAGNQIVVENYSGFKATAAITISAGANAHVFSTLTGTFLQSGIAVTCTNTPAWAASFAYSQRNAVQLWSGASFAACTTSTGKRYTTELGGGIETNAAGATFLPGTVAGTATNPGWYN